MVSCQNVSVKYNTGFAIKNIEFDVKQGDYLYIVGENGSGKSTLMKAILGLLVPCEGKISFSGLKQNEIGYMPQQTIIQKDFPASVFEVVLSGCLNKHGLFAFYRNNDKNLATEKLKLLKIESLKNKSYRDLSGGQQQRVLLARALCATEKLLMLDEPVSGLDPLVSAEMYALFNKLNSEMGITIIMVSHDIRSAVQYGKKILHMQTSQNFFGTTENYLKTDAGRAMLGGEKNA